MYGAERKVPRDLKTMWEGRINDARLELQAACNAQAEVHLAAFEAKRKNPPREAKAAVEPNDYKELLSPEDTVEKD